MLATRLLAIGAACVALGCGTTRPKLEGSRVKVSEVHFDPSSEQVRGEFIEIVNLGTAPEDLSDWGVTGAGRIALPPGTKIPAGGVIVVAKDKAACEKLAGRSLDIAATFPGRLRSKGETIRVEDPTGRVADEVSYDPADPEVAKARGSGLSIHRVDYGASGLKPGTTWKAARPTPGSVK